MVPLGIGETSGSEETGKRINTVGMNTSLHSGLMHPETGQRPSLLRRHLSPFRIDECRQGYGTLQTWSPDV